MTQSILQKIAAQQARDPSGFAHLYEYEAPREVLRELRDEGLILMTLSFQGVAACKITALGRRVLDQLKQGAI